MAQGYPSRGRAQKAYWRGVKTAKTGRGINPYKNDVLKRLFERGKLNPGATPPPQYAPKPVSDKRKLSDNRRGDSRGGRSDTAFGRPLRGYGAPPPPPRRPRPF